MPGRSWAANNRQDGERVMSSDRGTTQIAGTGAGTFSAADLKRRMAERAAASAAEELRHMREQEEKQKAVMEEFHKPPARSPEQLMQLIMRLVAQAVESRQMQSQIFPLPNRLGTHDGSRVNTPLHDR